MGHYAKVVDGKVTKVLRAQADFFESYVDDSPGKWIKTSYNTRGGKHLDPVTGQEDGGTPLRYNFAGIGYHYDKVADAFYPPQPYSSWILNTNTYLWEPPVPMPDNDNRYYWNEETQTWDQVND